MFNFPITLNIKDECCSKCNKSVFQQSVIIYNTTQTINLQGTYLLSVIEVDPNFIRIIIQNGLNVIIRTVYNTYATQVCLPTDCCDVKHVITLCTQVCKV